MTVMFCDVVDSTPLAELLEVEDFRDVISAGIRSGSFRPVEVPVTSLLIFGGSQWAWTWFRPAGPKTAGQVGSALVDLILGSLLVDRAALPGLASPDGPAAQTLREAASETTRSLAS